MTGTFVEQILGVVDGHYDIGRVVTARHLTSGTVNANFLVAAESGDGREEYVVRCYRCGRTEARLRYEHHLLQYLEQNGFPRIAAPIRSRDGTTWVRGPLANGGDVERYVAVFPRLAGEDCYSWDRPGCGTAELTSAAAVLAEYHCVVSGLRGGSAPTSQTVAEEVERTLLHDHLPVRRQRFDRSYGGSRDRVHRQVRDVLDRTLTGACANLPRLVIHRDFHPGNCLWANGRVVGLLDFDWADLDVRGLDVALAAVYFCTVWSDQPRGADWPQTPIDTLCLERLTAFASAYQQAASAGSPGPLEMRERESMPTLIALANLFVLAWVVSGAALNERPEQDSLRYLEHHLRLMDWIAANQGPLRGAFGDGRPVKKSGAVSAS